MSLLLAADQVELYPSEGTDEHGLAKAAARPCWTGVGNLQLGAGASDPRAADGGGRGLLDPAAKPSGLLFLPAEAAPEEGWTARIRGQLYALAQVRLVVDPAGGSLDCWMTTAIRWPDG